MTTNEPKLDLLDKMVKFEAGKMEEGEALVFFQELVDTGRAWTLHKNYGRTAAFLIREGMIVKRGVH